MNKEQKKLIEKELEFQNACGLGKIEKVYDIISNFSIDIKCNSNNAIKWAMLNNHIDVVKFLINKGALQNNNIETFVNLRIKNKNIINLIRSNKKLLNF